MSFANPAMRSMRLIVNLGFDLVWFALAVIACLFVAGWLSEFVLHWFMIQPVPPVESIPAF